MHPKSETKSPRRMENGKSKVKERKPLPEGVPRMNDIFGELGFSPGVKGQKISHHKDKKRLSALNDSPVSKSLEQIHKSSSHPRATIDSSDLVYLDDSEDGERVLSLGRVAKKRKKTPLGDARSMSFSHISRPSNDIQLKTMSSPCSRSSNSASPHHSNAYITDETSSDAISIDERGESNKLIDGLDPNVSEAIKIFSKKFKLGIQFMKDQGLITDDITTLATFLMNYNEHLSKEQLGEALSQRDHIELLKSFVGLIDFKGLTLTDGLRIYLSKFMLPGEAQIIDRMMETFAEKYILDNPNIYPNKDAVFVLSFSIIMLNTDRYNPSIAEKDKMTKEQFIRNNRETWDGKDPPRELLEILYDDIVCNEIILRRKGDPIKKGWVKSIKSQDGSYEQSKRWVIIVENEIRWYKNPTLGHGEEKLIGKLKLELVTAREEDVDKIVLCSVLPKNMSFSTFTEKGKESTSDTVKLIFTFENHLQRSGWVNQILQCVTFEFSTEYDPKDFLKPSLFKKKGKKEKY